MHSDLYRNLWHIESVWNYLLKLHKHAEFAQGFLPTKDGTENNCLATRLIAEEVTERLNRAVAKH